MSFYDNPNQLLYETYHPTQKLGHDGQGVSPSPQLQNSSLNPHIQSPYSLARGTPAILKGHSNISHASSSHMVHPSNHLSAHPLHPSPSSGSLSQLHPNSFHLINTHIHQAQPHSSSNSILELGSGLQDPLPQSLHSQHSIPHQSLAQHPLSQPTHLSPVDDVSHPQPSSVSMSHSTSQSPEPLALSRRVLLALVSSSSTRPKRKNRPGKRFGAKKKSWVWSWFTQDSENHSVAACDYCGKVVVRIPSDKGSPKKLMEHLRLHGLSATSINYSRTDAVPEQDTASPASNFSHISNTSVPTPGASLMSDESNTSMTSDISDSRLSMILALQSLPTLKPASLQQCASVPTRYISPQFDNTAYSPMKFYNHLLNFLRDNKLPLSTIQTHSFQQMVYDLKSDALKDMLKLSEMYADILDVNRYTENE